jgi:transposase InsO family protein
MEFTMAEKKKIAAQFAPRYRTAGKGEKSRILDEYPALSGGKSRKYAIFKLNRIGKTHLRLLDGQTVTVKIVEKSRKKRVYHPYYDEQTAAALESLWKNFNYPCGKLFAPFLRLNLDLIRLRKKYPMSAAVAAKLKTISPRTIDRLLHKAKQQMKIRGTSGTKPVRLLHRAIPILTWLQYAHKPSGFFQIDLVQHDGGNPSGEFCYTLTMTDVKTGWTVHFALMNKASSWVLTALDRALTSLPMGLKGIHSDTGSEFINKPVGLWCRRRGVDFSRGRPPIKTTIVMSSRRITPPSVKLSGISAARGTRGQPPSKPSMTPTTLCSTCIPLHEASQL